MTEMNHDEVTIIFFAVEILIRYDADRYHDLPTVLNRRIQQVSIQQMGKPHPKAYRQGIPDLRVKIEFGTGTAVCNICQHPVHPGPGIGIVIESICPDPLEKDNIAKTPVRVDQC